MTLHFASCATENAHIGAAFLEVANVDDLASKLKEIYKEPVAKITPEGGRIEAAITTEEVSSDIIIDPKFIGRLLTKEEVAEAVGDNGIVLDGEERKALNFGDAMAEATRQYQNGGDAETLHLALIKIGEQLKTAGAITLKVAGPNHAETLKLARLYLCHITAIAIGTNHMTSEGRTVWNDHDAAIAGEAFSVLEKGTGDAARSKTAH